MKEIFQNCEVEGHIQREVLTVVHVGVCERVENLHWFKYNSFVGGSVLTVFLSLPALMDGDGTEMGSTDWSMGSP